MRKIYLLGLFIGFLFVLPRVSKAQTLTVSTNTTITAAQFATYTSIIINAGDTLTVTGNISVSGSTAHTITDNGDLIINGNFSYSGSGNFSITGTGAMNVNGNFSNSGSGNFSVTGISSMNVTGSFAVSASGNYTNGVNTTIGNGFTYSGSGNIIDNGTLDITGNATFSGSGNLSGTGSMTITGTYSNTGSGTVFGGAAGCTDCTISTSGVSSLDNCSYKYNRRIKIDHTKVLGGADLTNFPVLISTLGLADIAKFKSAANGGNVQNANGYDIIFTDADGVTPLSFQMENYVANTGEYEAWVNVPNVSASADTYIYMYYGDVSVSTNQSSTSTWDANYKGVWHFNNNSFLDGTAGSHTATNNGSTNNTAAKIADGRTFSGAGSNNIIIPTSSPSGNSNGTIELWGKYTTAVNSTYFYGSSSTQNATYTDRVQLYQSPAGTLELGLGTNHSLATVMALTVNTWYHIVLTWANTGASVGNYTVYVNGVNKATGTYPGFATTYSTASLGNDGNAGQNSEEMTGSIDEARVSNIARTAGWVATEYNSQNSPSTFAIIAAEPYIWTGGTNTNWTKASNWTGSAVPPSSTGTDIIIFNGTHQPTLNASEQVGTISLASGATLTLGAGFSLSVANDVINCGTLTSTSTGTLNMNSTSPINQNISGSGAYSVGCLTINNTAATPSVTLNSPVTVSTNLILTKGLLNTDIVNILTMQNGSVAPALTSASTSYINGPMIYQLATATKTTLNLPIGASPDCRPALLTLQHTSATQYNYTCQVFNANPWTVFTPVAASNMPSTCDTISGVHYWKIDRTDNSGASQPTAGLSGSQQIQLFFGTNDGVYQGANLTVVKTTSGNTMPWIDIVGSCALGNFSTSQAGSITSSGANFTSFSGFTLGSKLVGKNPLPISLLDFTAIANNNKVDLKWETATETNNAYFTIEKSKDGVNFTKLIDMPGAGNSTSEKDYYESDYQPFMGLSYYRLKQTDFNGKYTYFPLRSVTFDGVSMQNITVYPNPINANQNLNIKVNGFKNQVVTVVLRDTQGREFLTKVLLSEDDTNFFVIDELHTIPAGSYIVTASSNDKIYNYKIIVK